MGISMNPDSVRKSAEAIKRNGESLKNIFDKVYNVIQNDMHNVWTGKQYLDFVNSYNEDLTAISNIVTLAREEIPATLKTKVDAFLVADAQEAHSDASYEKITYAPISVSLDEVISIDEASVYELKDALTRNFSDAKELMGSIETDVNAIEWQSEKADEFRTKVKECKNAIETSFDNLEARFSAWIQDAVEALQKADQM